MTGVAGHDRTEGGTAVSANGISVIALFGTFQDAIAAIGLAERRTIHSAVPPRFNATEGTAAVTVPGRVLVLVTFFRTCLDAISAENGAAAGGTRATPPRFHLAGVRTTVAGKSLSVIALFPALLDAIAAIELSYGRGGKRRREGR